MWIHIGCKWESILFVNHGQQWKSTCISREVTKLGINFTKVNDPCGVCGLRTRLQWRKINWLIDWCLTPTFSKKRFLGARYEHAIVSCLNNHCDMHTFPLLAMVHKENAFPLAAYVKVYLWPTWLGTHRPLGLYLYNLESK
jgi:hypothetical protein